MNQYPTWKNLLVLICVIAGISFALPNFYGEDPALMIAKENGLTFSEQEIKEIENFLSEDSDSFRTIEAKDGDVLIRFDNVEDQIKASDKVRAFLGRFSTVALTFAPNVPDFIDALDMKPMSLGLDLRGGVYFQFQVDLDSAVQQRLDQYITDINKELIDQRIRRTIRKEGNSIRIELVNPDDFNATRRIVRELDNLLAFENVSTQSQTAVLVTMTDDQLKQRRDFAIQQNILTMRNRVNELGVAEPIIQRQGDDRILVQLPGLDDPERIKRLLGKTARMNFRMVNETASIDEAMSGRVPPGSDLLFELDPRTGEKTIPYIIYKRIGVSGDQLVDANPSMDQYNQPVVSLRFDSTGSRKFGDLTSKNVGKRFAIVLDGEVISAPVIREAITGGSGQISGNFTFETASDLAVLLRAGALPAPLTILEERSVGPSLGKDSINAGMYAALIAIILVIIYMLVIYGGRFGVTANISLIINILLILALLGVLDATLTLPGLAGIALTIGMAVDANVLIFERIREESRSGRSNIGAIDNGFKEAFRTIVDANITTLIAAVILFQFGSGPVKGFAVTLALGVLTTMFSSLLLSRGIITIWYNKYKPNSLNI